MGCFGTKPVLLFCCLLLNLTCCSMWSGIVAESLILSYFNIVRKSILDMVPKTIMCFLVNCTKGTAAQRARLPYVVLALVAVFRVANTTLVCQSHRVPSCPQRTCVTS